MGVTYNTSIVRDGLVLYLDAANKKSYPGTGTAWNDLSGNGNNFTLFSSPAWTAANGGVFRFLSSDYASSAYQQPAQNTTTSFTWGLWVQAGTSGTPTVLGCRNNTLNFTKLTTNTFEYYPTNVGGAMPLAKWLNIVIVKNNTGISYYTNGVLSASGTSSATKTALPFFVGGDPLAPEYSNCFISSVQVYHRALTITEIEKNFNAHRGRFGI